MLSVLCSARRRGAAEEGRHDGEQKSRAEIDKDVAQIKNKTTKQKEAAQRRGKEDKWGWYVQKRKSQKGCRDLPQEDSNFPVFFWWDLADKDKVNSCFNSYWENRFCLLTLLGKSY